MRRIILCAFAGLAIVATTAHAGLFSCGGGGGGSSYSYSYSSGGCYGGGNGPFAKMKARRMARHAFVALPSYAAPVYTAPVPTPQNYGECIPGVGCPAPIPPSLVPAKGSTSLVPDYPDPVTLASNVDYKLYDDPGPDPKPQRLVAMNELY